MKIGDLVTHIDRKDLGVVTYALTDHFIYTKMSDNKYDRLFAVFLFLSGIVLMYKGLA